jgi:20S proteasome alpha/beta subunit
MVLAFSHLSLGDAAHSRRRKVVYVRSEEDEYDRFITTFDPSGRLMQVEYSRHAADRGASVMAYLHKDQSIYILVTGADSRISKVHRLDHHVFLVTAGLSADATTLARYLRSFCQDYRQEFGEAPSIQDVAKHASSFQHYLTRMGGTRPLGLTAMVIGMDPQRDHAARLYRTDPGGILEDCLYFAGGKDQDKVMKKMTDAYESIGELMNQHEIASMLVRAMAEATGDKELELDVWIIHKNDTRRGNLEALCLSNVRADRTDVIETKLDQ